MTTDNLAILLQNLKDCYYDELAAFSSFHQGVVRDFGYYRDCEFKLADALDRSRAHLDNTSELFLRLGASLDNLAGGIGAIKQWFNFPSPVSPPKVQERPSRVILKFPFVKVIEGE